jgi:hypothetical protein
MRRLPNGSLLHLKPLTRYTDHALSEELAKAGIVVPIENIEIRAHVVAISIPAATVAAMLNRLGSVGLFEPMVAQPVELQPVETWPPTDTTRIL